MDTRTFTKEDSALPMNYPGFVFRTLRDDGYEVDALLSETGLTDELLGDPNHRCDFAALRRFILNAIEVTGDPHLGVRLASQFEPNNIGLPAYAAMNAARFKDAIEVLARFFFLTFPSIEFTAPDVQAEPEADEVAIRLRPKLSFGDIGYFVSGSALVACNGLFKAILRTNQVATRAETTISKPEGWATVAMQVGFPIRFEAAENRLVFPAELLDRPLPGDDPINHARLLALCEQSAAEVEFEITPAAQVVAFLEAEEHPFPPLAETAEALGYSERGLRRHLERSGTSYLKLAGQIRERRAREMLVNTSRPIQTIADELGFDTPSNFARSFKRWTGSTPTAFRNGRRAPCNCGQK